MPTLTPFFFHWYVGDEPPFVGVAVKVIVAPEQAFVLLALMLMLGLGAT